MTAMGTIEITEVEQRERAGANLAGCRLDIPRQAWEGGGYSFEIVGWALGDPNPFTSIEVNQEGRIVTVGAPTEERLDIGAAFPTVTGAEHCGFRIPVSALDLRQKFELSLIARGDGFHTPIGKVRGRRQGLPAGDAEIIQPLMVNTIGRSGSTWLVWLLSCLNEAVAFSPWTRDPRVGTYWTGVLQGLARPQSYLAQLVPGPLDERTWWLDREDLKSGLAGDPKLEAWLASEAVESIAAMCQTRIEAFYKWVAGPTADPRYFVEKFMPYQLAPDLLTEMYPGAREVILVRDFRDLLCSVIAFNRKRGFEAFGRVATETDAQYVETRLLNSARDLLERWRALGDAAHLVRYEDLIQSPAATLGSLMEFLDIEPAEEQIAATLGRADSEAPNMDPHKTSDKISASIGRWERDLSPELIAVCGEVLDPVLTEFGYESTPALVRES
jgi:hypothetical protein